MQPYPTNTDGPRRILVEFLKVLLKLHDGIYIAREGRLDLSRVRESQELAPVLDFVDFNSVSFCQCLCEAIRVTVGGTCAFSTLTPTAFAAFATSSELSLPAACTFRCGPSAWRTTRWTHLIC